MPQTSSSSGRATPSTATSRPRWRFASPRFCAGRRRRWPRSWPPGPQLGDLVERVDVAGPGFLNLTVGRAWYEEALAEILGAGDRFGSGSAAESERIQVELVSANPTGPVTVASARNGAYGDSVARLLAFAGHDVEREYYYNDAGAQIGPLPGFRRRGAERGGTSRGRLPGGLPPRAGRPGRRSRSPYARPDRGDPRALPHPLRRLGAPESSFRRSSPSSSPHLPTYEKDGAVFVRSTDFGDDKDRVLVRSPERGGTPTYAAADIAYLRDKLERAFDRAIYVLGADHHGSRGWYEVARADARLRPRARRGAALPARAPDPRRRGDEDVEAARRRRPPRRASSTRSASTRRAGTSSTAATTSRSRSTSTWHANAARRTPSTTSSTPTPGSPGSCGTPARPSRPRR